MQTSTEKNKIAAVKIMIKAADKLAPIRHAFTRKEKAQRVKTPWSRIGVPYQLNT